MFWGGEGRAGGIGHVPYKDRGHDRHVHHNMIESISCKKISLKQW